VLFNATPPALQTFPASSPKELAKKSDPAVRGRDRNGNSRMPRKMKAFGQGTPRRAPLNVQPSAYCAALKRYVSRTERELLPG
jgi:hypothetical protein